MATDLTSIQEKIGSTRFEEALADLEQVLAEDPVDQEAIYMSAVCRRYLHDHDGAIADLRRLQSLSPEHGRAYQEEGHLYRDQGNAEAALLAYSRACQFNPALIASWKEQHRILKALGRQANADFVAARIEKLEGLPKPLLAVMDLIAQGKLIKAETLCRKFLMKVPDQVEAMRLLADIGSRLGVLDDAEVLLKNAVAFAPDYVEARIDYISVLRKKQKYQRALQEAEALLKLSPDNLQFQSIHAIECMQSGDYETALAGFDAILTHLPTDPITLTSKGHLLKTIGQTDEAVAAYQGAVTSAPGHGEAYYSLANLKTYRFSDTECRQMEDQLQRHNLSYMDRVYLNFALGKAREDQKSFSDAFTFYSAGNELKKRQSRYSADQMSEEFVRQKTVCTRELLARRTQSGCPAPDPIFIVGLPRAGSTLLEQILASHSQIDGTLELPDIPSLSHRLRYDNRISSTSKYPAVLSELDDSTLRQFGERYLEDTRVHRGEAPFFIDKMPNNFRHIGLIKLILPNAKIIDARRDPMSCCFSAYKQLFAEGQEFSYSLEDVGRYYHDYVDLMAHWNQVLPGEILTVSHEDVVDDLESQVRRMLEFCGLEFEPGCLNYYDNERSVRTPSSEQVRQPIFRSSLETWKQFEPWLDPLKQSLGDDLRNQYKIEL